jgi:hypothetical protein
MRRAEICFAIFLEGDRGVRPGRMRHPDKMDEMAQQG